MNDGEGEPLSDAAGGGTARSITAVALSKVGPSMIICGDGGPEAEAGLEAEVGLDTSDPGEDTRRTLVIQSGS